MKKLFCIIFALLLAILSCACDEEVLPVQSEDAESSEETLAEEKPYYFFVFNSKYLSSKDKDALENIRGIFAEYKTVDFDVRDVKTASDIYMLLKSEHEARGGELKGIQIFGDSKAVPPFSIDHKVALANSVQEKEAFLSDYFFSNFNNSISDIEPFNIYDNFEGDGKIDFYPRWCVARLPLARGKYSLFYENYCEYKALTEKQNELPVGVSSPIFRTSWFPVSIDDIGHFLQRAKNEWHLLDELKLYANTEGFYPSPLDVDGNCRAEEWTAESKERVCEYYISGHAGEIAFLQTVYTSESEYECKRIISFSDINTYLADKPYFINTVGCDTAKNMRDNIIQNAMRGKCVGAFASTTTISNLEIDCMASRDRMENGFTYHSLFYNYMEARSNGIGRAESFLNGQQKVAASLEQNRATLEPYQYHYNYHNLLALHNFGIIDQ